MKSTKEEADYWLFSNELTPKWARLCNDIPLDMLNGVTDEEAQAICAQIRERLENGDFYVIYINVLVFFNDQSSLDILKKQKQQFIEKRRVVKSLGNYKCKHKLEIRLLKSAIKHLKKVKP